MESDCYEEFAMNWALAIVWLLFRGVLNIVWPFSEWICLFINEILKFKLGFCTAG